MDISKVDEYIHVADDISVISRSPLEKLQLEKLNALLERVSGRGFYKSYPRSINSLADIKRLPFVTEDDIIESAMSFGMVSQSKIARIITDQTSGTTGDAKRIFYTEADREKTALFFEIGLQEIIGAGDVVMLGFPESGELGLTDLIDIACERIGATTFNAQMDTDGALAQLDELSPNVYIGHPDHMRAMLNAAESAGTSMPIKRSLISGGVCPESLSARIADATGTRPILHYGSREIGLAGAVACDARHGMHIRENDLYIEIVGESGEPVEDGEYGEIVITTLSQEAMPLIRYKTQDWGRILPQPCKCGSITRCLDPSICRI